MIMSNEIKSSILFLFVVIRVQQTMIRINKVQIVGKINEPPAVTGLETAIL